MPCVTEVASGRELELGWITELLKEAVGRPHSYSQVAYDYYGHGSTQLDRMTAELCRVCLALGENKIATMSPQFRYWWKRHQFHDALRAFRKEIGLDGDYPEGL